MISAGGAFLCAGNIVQDILVRPVERVAFDATAWVEAIELRLGGNGSNTSYALAKLGVPVRALGLVGADDFGEKVVAKMAEAGVDCAGVTRGASATASTVVLVKADGTRGFLHCPGASIDAFSELIDFSAIDDVSYFHLANLFSLPHMRRLAADNLWKARDAGLKTSMDTGWDSRGEWIGTLKPCLPYLDLLFVNQGEARWLTGHEEPRRAAQTFRDSGVPVVVIKLGARGCAVFSESGEYSALGYSVPVVDTTGAGDCFAGGFLAALHRGASLPEAARFANAVGALSVQKLGSVEGLRTYDETLEWMAVPEAEAAS